MSLPSVPFDKNTSGLLSRSSEYSIQLHCEKRGLLGALSSSVATSTSFLSHLTSSACVLYRHGNKRPIDEGKPRGESGGGRERVNCEGVDSFANFAMLLKPQMRKGAGLEKQTNSQWEAHVVSH